MRFIKKDYKLPEWFTVLEDVNKYYRHNSLRGHEMEDILMHTIYLE